MNTIRSNQAKTLGMSSHKYQSKTKIKKKELHKRSQKRSKRLLDSTYRFSQKSSQSQSPDRIITRAYKSKHGENIQKIKGKQIFPAPHATLTQFKIKNIKTDASYLKFVYKYNTFFNIMLQDILTQFPNRCRINYVHNSYIESIYVKETSDENFLYFPVNLSDILTESYENRKRFVCLPLIITTDVIGHQNVLIFDLKKKELTRFEPHGALVSYGHGSILNDFINLSIQEHILPIVRQYINTYQSPIDYFLDKKGLQYLERKVDTLTYPFFSKTQGFCMIFSLWFVFYRLRNPDILNSLIISHMMIDVGKNIRLFNDYIIQEFQNNIISQKYNTTYEKGDFIFLLKPDDYYLQGKDEEYTGNEYYFGSVRAIALVNEVIVGKNGESFLEIVFDSTNNAEKIKVSEYDVAPILAEQYICIIKDFKKLTGCEPIDFSKVNNRTTKMNLKYMYVIVPCTMIRALN